MQVADTAIRGNRLLSACVFQKQLFMSCFYFYFMSQNNIKQFYKALPVKNKAT